MDTIVIKTGIKIMKCFVGILLLTTVLACPGDEDCFDMANTTRVNDLIKLLPEQSEYNQGDVVTLSLTIPATNSYFGSELNLFQETADNSARLRLGFSELFTNNTFNIIIGSQANSVNRFFMPYNVDNDTYQLEVEIILDSIGNYSFVTDDTIEFIGEGCDRFVLDTNVLWAGDALVEFTVVE